MHELALQVFATKLCCVLGRRYVRASGLFVDHMITSTSM